MPRCGELNSPQYVNCWACSYRLVKGRAVTYMAATDDDVNPPSPLWVGWKWLVFIILMHLVRALVQALQYDAVRH